MPKIGNITPFNTSGGGTSSSSTLTGNNGLPVAPDGSNNISLLGDTSQGVTITGTPGAHTLTTTVADASTLQKGVSLLSTNAEAIAGSNASVVVTPSNLNAKLGLLTQYALPIGGGLASPLSWTAPPTDGQLLIGSTGLSPALATLTAGAGITITNNPGGITIATSMAGAEQTLTGNNGVIVQPDGSSNINVVGDGTVLYATGNNGTNTITISIAGQVPLANGGTNANLSASNGGIFYSNATQGQILAGTATANQILLAGSNSAPSWSSTTYPVSTAQGDLLYASMTNTLTTLAKNTTATRYLANTGTSNNPNWDQVNLTNGVTGILPAVNGGTGFNGSTAANGTLPIGNGSGFTLAALSPGTGISITNGSGSITIASDSTVATTYTEDSGTATPSGNNLNILGTSAQGISTSGSGSTVTITASSSTTSQKGVVALATNAEAIAGTDTTKAITSDDLTAKLGAQTAHGLPIGAGTSSALTWTAALTDGQLLIGSTSADPELNTLTAGTNISISNGAGSITISANISGQVVNYARVSGTYTASATDYFISCDTSGGTVTVRLPNSTTTGRIFVIKDGTGNAVTNPITITTPGGAVDIDASTSYIMDVGFEAIEVIFNGTSYEVY